MKLHRNVSQHAKLCTGVSRVDLFSNGRVIALDFDKIGNFQLVSCIPPKVFELES